jgi:hypothetical protein
MKKRTIKAGKFQRHYATNGILMYRERKNLIEVPEGTMVTVLKARRQSHLCSVRCVTQEVENKGAVLVLGSGKKAEEICLAIPVDHMPKLKIEGAAPTKGKGKGNKKATAALPVVAIEGQANQPEIAPGVAPADIAPQPAAEAPAPAPQAEAPAPAPEAAPVEVAAV